VEPVIFTPRRLVLRRCWCFTAGSLLKGSKPIGSCTSTASSTITIVEDGVIPGTTRFVAVNQLSKQQTHNRLEERRRRGFQDLGFWKRALDSKTDSSESSIDSSESTEPHSADSTNGTRSRRRSPNQTCRIAEHHRSPTNHHHTALRRDTCPRFISYSLGRSKVF
jgi:hypothetical protein